MSPSTATLLLPTPAAAWSLWKPRSEAASEELDSPADWRGTTRALVVGLPATACRTLGLALPPAEHDVLEQMVETQLERLGLKTTGGALPHRWHLLGQTSGRMMISVDVLTEPFPAHLLAEHAADYVAALRLLRLPEQRLVVVEEQAEWVVAVGLNGALFRSHIIGPAGMSPKELGHELMLTHLALQAQAAFPAIEGITLVGRGWEADRVAEAAGLPVTTTEALPRAHEWRSPETAPLLPLEVQEARAARVRRARWLRAGVFAALLYASLVFLGYAYMKFQNGRLENLQAQIDQSSTPAAEARSTASRWKAMTPALEPTRFPMVMLAEMTSLLPPSGIVIRQFRTRVGEVEMRGEARDPQLAYQFLEDLQKQRIFSQYELSMPQPSVRDGSASFRIQGKLK
ncbi:MAG: hypothetical protein KDK99_10045 [Verrucomicrobiales bacterium]|nr:hypothetical protein [Verrucomicrobiales bacterium]